MRMPAWGLLLTLGIGVLLVLFSVLTFKKQMASKWPW